MLLSSIWAATPENPRFDLNSPEAWDALGAQPTSSGMRVNRKTALRYSPFYRAVSLISAAMAKLPIFTYRTQGNGKALDPSHPAYPLMRWKPNPRQIAFNWKRQMQVQSLVDGNAYSYIVRRGDAVPLELLPLDPLTTFPVIENGRLWYVTEVNTDKRKLLPEDVLHFYGLSDDGIMGLSIRECAEEALGLGMGGQRYGAIFLKNNARASVVIKSPLKLPDKTKNELREGWERMHTGLDNAHRTAILDGGLDLKEVTINARDAQLIEMLEANGIDIANFFDLAPSKLGNTKARSYASNEQDNQAFLDDCLDPRLIAAEEQMRDKLLTEQEKADETHVIEFHRKGLIKANMQTRSAYFRTALGGRPWMTQNEVRDEEGLNPLDTPEADQVLEPLNMGQGGAQNDPPPAEDVGRASSDASDAAGTTDIPLLSDAVRRMVHRVALHGGRLEKAVKSPSAFVAFVDSLESVHGDVFRQALNPIADGMADWTLRAIAGELEALADTATAKSLPGDSQALIERLESWLPEEAARYFADHYREQIKARHAPRAARVVRTIARDKDGLIQSVTEIRD